MSASISDPFLLSSYALPSHSSRPSSSPSLGQNSHVLASISDKNGGFATVAVQGDGVHVLDLSTLHPVVSHTLGPSTSYSCPPITRTAGKDGGQVCKTYAAIDSSSEVSQDARGRTVWVWEENLSGGVMSGNAQSKRKSSVISHPISHIYAPDDLDGRILLVGPTGKLTVTDADLSPLATFPEESPDAGDALQRHFVFSRNSCSFVSGLAAPSQGLISVSVVLKKSTKEYQVSVVAFGRGGDIHPLGDCPLPLSGASVADMTCSASGNISVLTSSGSWHSYILSPSPSSSTFSLKKLIDPINLTSLSFTSASQITAHRSEISLLPLSSSHVLLASISHSSPEIVVMVWDMQYGVLLAEQHCVIPSTLGRSKQRGVHMQLVGGSPGNNAQVLLALSPAADSAAQADANSLRTTVLVVPVTAPSTSTIAAALGRASASAKWLKTATKQQDVPGINASQKKVLNVMRIAMEQKRVEAAEKAFDEWVATHTGQEGKPRLGHLFVKQVLDIAFLVPAGAAKNATALPCASKVIRYLLAKAAVSDAMVEGGLIPVLRSHKDLQSAALAVQTVKDLPETDVISLLATVVTQHRQTRADENAMQVDSLSELPTLPSFLALCVKYPTSPAALRVALRQQFSETEDLMCILGVLDAWVDKWCNEDVSLLPDRVKKDAHGVLVPQYAERETEEVPSLDKVLSFTQSVLDASFLALLAHRPAHKLLRTLLSRIQPELALTSELLSLQGPLQPFAATHARAVREGAHGASKADTKVDWRRRKKMAHEQAEMSLGLYQVEELVL